MRRTNERRHKFSCRGVSAASHSCVPWTGQDRADHVHCGRARLCRDSTNRRGGTRVCRGSSRQKRRARSRSEGSW
ncbi:hypothetical protein G6F57_023635 [Rhizopus arrhizus]|nr:hypothetical protein G6F57_023635 [Rhizopus arrhizus]